MLTSLDILKTLAERTDIIAGTLDTIDKHQLIRLLSAVAEAKDEENREDAVDALYEFCRDFSTIDGLLDDTDIGGYSAIKGRPHFLPTAKEEEIRLYANRLIKAVKISFKESGIQKEKKRS